MGIFTRFRDIVSSNINAMLDGAENPEKMIKLMIREMEDTLIELKASCAGAMATSKKVERRLSEIKEKEQLWHDRASLAVNKGKDNLAREALLEKRKFSLAADSLISELNDHSALVKQYHEDIRELEEKLDSAKDKKRTLMERHKRATTKKRAQSDIRYSESAEAMARFDQLESRIEQMEAEADLVNVRKKRTLDDEFDDLHTDDEIERELADIKAGRQNESAGQ